MSTVGGLLFGDRRGWHLRPGFRRDFCERLNVHGQPDNVALGQ